MPVSLYWQAQIISLVTTHSSRRISSKRVVFGFIISSTVKMASRIVSSATVKAVKGRRPIQTRAALVLVCDFKR